MKKETLRINATRKSFVIEKRTKRKGAVSWDAIAWYSTPEHVVRAAIDLKAKSLINAHEKNVADALREASKMVRDLLKPGKAIAEFTLEWAESLAEGDDE